MTVALLFLTVLAYAQPKTPKEEVSPEIPQMVREHIENLYSLDAKARADAAASLGEIGWINNSTAYPAVPFLSELLSDSSIDVQRKAAEALGKIRDEKAVIPLIKAFCFKDQYLNEDIALALVSIGKSSVEPLIAYLKDDDPDIRSWSAYTLGKIKDTSSIKPLIELLDDEKNYVRGRAASALGQLGGDQAQEGLIKALKDADADVRRRAAFGLGTMQDAHVADYLIAALKDNSVMVRNNAATALGKMRAKEAVGPLIEALSDENSGIADRAAWALGQIGDLRALEPLLKALYDRDGLIRLSVVKAAGNIRSSKAVDVLIKVLDSDDNNAKTIAILSLGDIGEPRAVPPLINMLKDKDMAIRWNTVMALGETKDARAIDPLAALYDKEESKNMRILILRILGNMANPFAIKPLSAALNDEDEDIQLAAVDALSKIDHPQAAQALEKAVETGGYYARLMAEQALRKVRMRPPVEEK